MSDPTRDLALALLHAVLDRRHPIEEALDALPSAAARDRAAAHRLAALTLRRLGSLDAALEPLLRRAPPPMVQHVLRLGAAGLLLGGTPPHAAVATAVALARGHGLAPFAGLVNAVLRRVAEGGTAALGELDGPRLDTPAWMWAAWGARARAIAEAHGREAPLDLTPNPRRPGPPPEGADVLPTGTWRLPAGTRVAEVAGFAEGAFWVQDAAASLPARLLDARPGERVADLCAAPGGKAMQLAATGAGLVALDRDAGRLGRVRENLARTGLEAELVLADAGEWRPEELLDAVLLDAPCSATGTVRRHPDVLRLKRPRDVEALAAGQRRLLAAAAAMLRPEGRLLYAVCSLQPEEGEQQVAAVEAMGLRFEPFAAGEVAAVPEALAAEGWVRTHPGLWGERGGMDGFFVARFRRKG